MPITVEWDDEAQTTLRCTFRGRCGWSELATLFTETIVPMMNHCEHEVDLIADVRYGDVVAEDALLHLKRLSRAANKQGLEFKGLALVGMARFYQSLRQLSEFPGAELIHVESTSLADARSRLYQLRRSRQRV